MRTLFALLFLCAFGAVPAVAATVNFFGTFQTVSKTNNAKCIDYDPVGELYVANYRPFIAGDPTNPRSRIGLFHQSLARSYQLATGSFSTSWQAVEGVDITAGSYNVTPQQYLRFATQVPAIINVSTPTITITGEILNYDGQLGCRIQFRMVLQKRI